MKVLKWHHITTGGTSTRRKVQNAMNKKRGLKTSVETSTISTNNISNVIFQFF